MDSVHFILKLTVLALIWSGLVYAFVRIRKGRGDG